MTIEEEIARSLRNADRPDVPPHLPVPRKYEDMTAALSPLLNRVRAEAAAQALEKAADDINRDFQSLPSWNAAWKTGERTVDWERGSTRTLIDTMDWLRARAASVRADAIEQNSEGNET